MMILGIDPHMEIFGMGPELWADRAKAWVEAIALVLDVLVAKVGVLGLAIIAVWQNFKAKAAIRETKERLDRQGERIDQVALAVPPAMTSTVKIEQPADQPIPVTETPTP
jgi:hypothetical protein